MATQVQFRRGSDSEHNSFTGVEGEITVNTTNKSIHVHDGSTVGGTEVARADLSNINNVGVITATEYYGTFKGTIDSGISLDSAAYATTAGIATYATSAGIATNAQGLTGTPNITVGSITADSATFSGNVSIAGTLTYDDVTYVDSLGIVTARNGIEVGQITSIGATISSNGNATFSGVVSASSFNGQLDGNASSSTYSESSGIATALQNARTFEITGDIIGSTVSFDGTSNVSIAATIQPNSVGLGTDTVGNYVATIVDSGSSDIAVSGSGSETAEVTVGLTTTGVSAGSYGSSTQIPTFTVDSRGRLTAAGSVNVATALTVAGDSGSEVINLGNEILTISGGTNLTSSSSSNTVTLDLDPNISLTNVNASGIITATGGFVGDLTGTATSTTNIPNLTGDITSVNTETTLATVNSNIGTFGSSTEIPSITVNAKGLVTGVTTSAITVGDGTLTLNVSGTGLSGSQTFTANQSGNSTFTVNSNATSNNTSSTIVARDSSGGFIAGIVTATRFFGDVVGDVTGNVTGNLVGLADSATKLATARTIALSGDVSGSVSFDGSSNVTITTTVADDSHNHTISNVDGLQTALDAKAPLDSPSLTGTPTAPTAAAGTNTTQVATTEFVSTAVSNLVDTAPGTLDTLNELAAALGDDPNFATTVSNQIGTKLDASSYTASDVLTKIKTVDGASSGLDADLLDGQEGSYYRNASNLNAGTISDDRLPSVISSDITGNAGTATSLSTARTIALTGDVQGSVLFDGSSNVSIAATIQPNSVALGSDTTGNYVATISDSGSTDIVVNNSGTESADVTLGLNSTGVSTGSYGSSTEIPTFTVDAKGRLTAAGSVSVSAGMTVTGDSGSENIDFLSETLTISGGTNLTSSASNNGVTINLDENISLANISASGVVTATSGFSGNLTGNVTGDLTGNADTATSLENARTIGGVSFDGTSNINLPGVNAAGNQDTSGNAATATSLETPRTIGGVSFDGTTNINLPGVNTAGNQDTSGNAATATKLATARSIALSGDVIGEVLFDGTSNVSIAATIQSNSVALGDDTTGNYVASITNGSYITGANGGSEGAALTLAVDATSTNTASKVVARDSSGNFSAGTITANLAGTATSTTNIPNLTGDITSVNTTTTLATVNSNVGTFGSSTAIPSITVNAKGLVTGVSTNAITVGDGTLTLATSGTGLSGSQTFSANQSGNATFTVTSNATSNNTNSTIVSRDGAGGFSAGIVTATQFSTGSGNIGITTNRISGPDTIIIDPAAVGDNTGIVIIKGDLQIDGTTTTINSTVVTVDDLNITLADGAANAAAANGAGITIAGANATLTYASTGDKWVSNKDVDAPNFNSTSDANLKENVEVYANALETIENLEGVSFTWKESQKSSIGVIAQQVENFVPELVQTGETHKTVNYNGLIGILIEAVKELSAEVKQLKEKR
jgi:hypothetical protein